MLVLTETTDNIQVVLAGSVTTNQLSCFSSWRDITTTTYAPGRTVISTNNTTDVNIVAAPASSTQRVVDMLSVYNADTVNATVTIKFDANGTEYTLWKGTLGTLEKLEYTEGQGFRVLTNAGAIKNSLNQGSNSVGSDMNIAVLGSDVTNNNASANTIANVTGLSFPVTTGHMYYFKFTIWYTAAATTTGSRWSINGPTTSMLNFMSEYSLAATTTTRNANNLTYDLPAASNATSSSTGANKAEVEGILTPTADGDVIARFASEVSSSAIVAKAGSYVQYLQLT